MDSEESDGMSSVSDSGAYWYRQPQQFQQQQQHHQSQHHQHQQQSYHDQHPQQQHNHHQHHHHQQQQQQQQHQHQQQLQQQQQAQQYMWHTNGYPHHQSYQQMQHYSASTSSAAPQQQHYPQQQQQQYHQQQQQQQIQLQGGGQAPPPEHLQSHPNRTTHCAERTRRQQHYELTSGDPMITSSLKGKQGKDGPDEKKDADGELWGNVEAQAAFLGPNLWEKTLPYDADLKYVDLDEFLSENGIPVDGGAGGGNGPGSMQPGQLHKMSNGDAQGPTNGAPGHQGPAGLHLEPVTKRERSPSPSDCCSPDTLNPPSPADSTLSMASSGRDFDPRTRAFSDEELKPQPMIKKSRKQFVPDDLKDDKYWARRRKNNMAAKRSRDARRMKENQIALRAGFLEKENMGLRQELDRLKNENMLLRDKLSKYTDV